MGTASIHGNQHNIFSSIGKNTKTEEHIGLHSGEKISFSSITNDIDEKFQYLKMQIDSGIIVEKKSIDQRSINIDQRLNPLSPQRINQFEKNVGNGVESAKLAKKYLNDLENKRALPEPAAKLVTMMKQYMGLQRLANALKNDNDNDFVALLTAAKNQPSTLDELAKILQEAGDDKNKIASFLEDIEGLPKDEQELYDMMKTLRYEPGKLKEKLRQAQNLPDLTKEEKNSLFNKIENHLREFELKDGGRIAASLNSLNAASLSDNPTTFIESFTDLVQGSEDFSRALQSLLQNYSPDELVKVLPLIKQALADDLAADPRSTDKIKLTALISEMSFMHISATLLELTKNLIKEINRIFRFDQKVSHGTR